MSELRLTDPADQSMDAERLEAVRGVLEEERQAGAFPGAVCAVSRGGKPVFVHCCGVLSPTRDQPVAPGTIFDMASVTKPMTAALAALRLVERGKLSLLQEVAEFFPGSKLPHLSGVTLRHLITHTSGLPAWVDLYTGTSTREEAEERLLSLPLAAAPGTRYEYSCLGYILLGLVCERVCGESLQDLLRREVWQPLGMSDTGYCPAPEAAGRIASTADCPARPRELVGEVHDGNAWRMGGVSGNAGLFSTAPDVLRFCHVLMGWEEGPRPLGRLALQRYTTSQIPADLGGQSFGWFCYGNQMLPSGDLLPPDLFGHTGFTGTMVLVVPSEELCIVLLTNRVCTDTDASRIRRTRRRVTNVIAAALT